jgi:hypothetical protein
MEVLGQMDKYKSILFYFHQSKYPNQCIDFNFCCIFRIHILGKLDSHLVFNQFQIQ